MYIEVIKKKDGDKVYSSTLLRENFREDGKVKHRTIANISKLPYDAIEVLKKHFKNPNNKASNDLDIMACREFGASNTFLNLARELKLDKMIYSKKTQWREDILALIVGRIINQGSKLKISNLFNDSALWELCGHKKGGKVAVNKHCYLPLDKLLKRQEIIQKQLAQKHLDSNCLVLYDITNTWLEGDYKDSKLVAYGKAKGGKVGYKQVAIGLICNSKGCPVAVEVFKGNTSDQMTVWEQVKKLAEVYKVENVIFAGDRGMLTPKRIEEVNSFGFKTLTALTHPQIRKLLETKVVQLELFDEQETFEVNSPDEDGVRFILCKNPETRKRSQETRSNLIAKTCEYLDKIKNSKRKQARDAKCARIGKVLAKYRVEKFFSWELDAENNLNYTINEEKVSQETALDGCYIIRTDVDSKTFNKEEAVFAYKQLAQVEQAFRNLKLVSLELRPIYHKTDERIKAHIFLCMLSYYLQWNALQRLEVLFKEDKKGSERRWSFSIVLERLKSIRKIDFGSKGIVVYSKVNLPDKEQEKILELLSKRKK